MITGGDLDYVSARVAGRSSELAAGQSLAALCALRSSTELGEALFPGEGLGGAAEVERRLVEDLAAETHELAEGMSGRRGQLLHWLCMRFALENLKVAVRALASEADVERARRLFVRLPEALGHGPELLGATTPEALLALLPPGPLRDALARSNAARPEPKRPFFHEAALEAAWLEELLARSRAVPEEDRIFALLLARQEVASYDLLLAARGRFFYRLPPQDLLPLFVEGSGVDLLRFAKMLEAPGVGALRALAAGAAVDSGPPVSDPSLLEALTQARRAHLAHRVFRTGNASFGAVLGYLALRRVEVSDLLTVCEGLRQGLPAAELLRRTTPHLEEGHA